MDLQELSDRAEIAAALHRYTRAVDTASWDTLDTVFTPDADIDYSESGGTIGAFPQVKAWLAENLYAFAIRTMHSLAQVVIDLDGDAAEVTAYFDNPMVISDGQGGERIVEVGGQYLHSFVRTPDGWRSKRLHEQIVWTRGF